MPLPGSHGIYSLPANTIDALVARDDPATALAAAATCLHPHTTTWLIHERTVPFPRCHAVTFTGDDTYHRYSFMTRHSDWNLSAEEQAHPNASHQQFSKRRHQLVLHLDSLFQVERSISRDLADPNLTRKPVHRAMLIPLLRHWWDARMTSGVTPQAAGFMLSLLLPLPTLAFVPLHTPSADEPATGNEDGNEDGVNEDDDFWLDPTTRMRAPIGYTLATPPLPHIHAHAHEASHEPIPHS